MRRCVLRSQFSLPPCFCHSFTAIWPGLTLYLFPGFCLSPSWEYSLTNSRDLAWLAHITKRTQAHSRPWYHFMWDFWDQARSPGYRSRPVKDTRPEADSFSRQILYFLHARKFPFKRTHTCFLKHSFPASTDCLGGAKKQPSALPPPLLPSTYFLSIFGETFTWGECYLLYANGKQLSGVGK